MEFVNKVENVIQQSCISFTLLAAKELGIFDILRQADRPLTSHQVADTKKLKERYVREVLGCLTSASLVQISANDEGEPTYYLHEDAKEKIDGGILSKLAQVRVIMSRYLPVKDCFPLDGPWAGRYDAEVFNFLDEINLSWRNDILLKTILDKVPGLRTRLEQGIKVIEFGSGAGHLLSKFAMMFPKSEFTASEMNDVLVTKMKDNCSKLSNLHFETIDLCQMSEFPSQKFDWMLAIQVIHDVPHPLVAMKNMRKMINVDGGLCMLYDMAGPGNPAACVGNDSAAVIYTISTFLCIPESFQAEDSEAHGATWGKDTAISMLKESGFEVNLIMLDGDEGIYHCECGK